LNLLFLGGEQVGIENVACFVTMLQLCCHWCSFAVAYDSHAHAFHPFIMQCSPLIFLQHILEFSIQEMRYIALPVHWCCLDSYAAQAWTTSLLTLHCFTCLSLSHSYLSLIFTSFHSQSICFVLYPCFLVGYCISFSVIVCFLSSSHPTSNTNGILMPLCYLLVLLLQFAQFECIQTSFVGVIVMISLLFLWHTYSWSHAATFINLFHALLPCVFCCTTMYAYTLWWSVCILLKI
jgi:hypothetical protein